MQVIFLVIVYRGTEHISVHDDQPGAWSALLRFVDDHWPDHSQGASEAKPLEEERLVQSFFAADSDSYFLGDADLSEIERYVEGCRLDDPAFPYGGS